MQFHRRDDVDEIEPLCCVEHVGRVAVSGARACGARRPNAPFRCRVADRRQHDVVHVRPCRQMVFGKEAAADQADPKRRNVNAIPLPQLVDFAEARAAPRASRGLLKPARARGRESLSPASQ